MTNVTPEVMRQNMTEAEWSKIFEMNRDRNLYQNLINSLFPSIHGNDQVKKGMFIYLIYLFSVIYFFLKQHCFLQRNILLDTPQRFFCLF